MNPDRTVLFAVIIVSANAYAQHDRCRNAVRLVADGQTDAAVKLLTGARMYSSGFLGRADVVGFLDQDRWMSRSKEPRRWAGSVSWTPGNAGTLC